MKLISKARCKTDAIDARKLADLLRTNLLPSIWVPDAVTRANRKLLRGYGCKIAQMDLAEHIGWGFSTHGNDADQHLDGKPLDRDKWGV